MKKVIVTADMNNIYVQAGEEAEVELTPQVKGLIEAGVLYDVTPVKPKPPKPPKP